MDTSFKCLPTEIIIKIFSYLSSTDLLILSKNKSSKLLTSLLSDRYVLNSIDFCSDDPVVAPQDVGHFLQLHSNHVQKICLNNLCPKSPFVGSVLFLALTNLCELHVKNCGFTMSNVVSFLPKIKTLKVFSWSIIDISHGDFMNIRSVIEPTDGSELLPSLIRLNIDSFLSDNVRLLLIIFLFPSIIHLQIDAFETGLAFFNWAVNKLGQSVSHGGRLPHLNSLFFNVVFGHLNFSTPNVIISAYDTILQNILEARPKNLPWEILQVWEVTNFTKAFGNPEPLEDVDASSCLLPGSKESVSIFIPGAKLPSDKSLLQSLAKRHRVERLTLANCTGEETGSASQMPVVEFLKTLTSSSCNLVEINLTWTHFAENTNQHKLVLRVLSEAHVIRRLAIPACIVPHVQVQSANPKKKCRISFTSSYRKQENAEDKPVLEYLVEGCPNLSELDIRSQTSSPVLCSCRSSKGICMDSDLEPISRLQKLEALTLIGLLGVLQLTGLTPHYAGRSLRLSGVGPQGQCRFWHNLQGAFGSMTALQELSLEHHQLPLDKGVFWMSFKKLVSLKRICITSYFQDSLQPKLILQFLRDVPCVRTLHIHSRAVNFKTTAKAIMSALKTDYRREFVPNIVIENLNSNERGLSSIYEKLRLCYKSTTVGSSVQHCALQQTK